MLFSFSLNLDTNCILGLIRLFNYGIGIHLLQSDDPESMTKNVHINPKDNHISFQVYHSHPLFICEN